jgi:hypothetical protein
MILPSVQAKQGICFFPWHRTQGVRSAARTGERPTARQALQFCFILPLRWQAGQDISLAPWQEAHWKLPLPLQTWQVSFSPSSHLMKPSRRRQLQVHFPVPEQNTQRRTRLPRQRQHGTERVPFPSQRPQTSMRLVTELAVLGAGPGRGRHTARRKAIRSWSTRA